MAETFKQWLQKSSPSISGFSAMTVTELLYKFEQYIQEHAIQGDQGVGIKSFKFISSMIVGSKTVNTYEITYTDNTTETVNIYAENGQLISTLFTPTYERNGATQLLYAIPDEINMRDFSRVDIYLPLIISPASGGLSYEHKGVITLLNTKMNIEKYMVGGGIIVPSAARLSSGIYGIYAEIFTNGGKSYIAIYVCDRNGNSIDLPLITPKDCFAYGVA